MLPIRPIQNQAQQAGFTLLELLLVLALLSILLVFAIPSYQKHQQHARRVQANHVLLQAVQRLTEEYGLKHRYLSSIQTIAPDSAHYQYRFASGPDASGFVLEAMPIGAQALDECGSLLLNQHLHKGAQGVLDNRAAQTSACWER